MSEALALCLANKTNGSSHEMHFGNGGTSVDPTGVNSYLPAIILDKVRTCIIQLTIK